MTGTPLPESGGGPVSPGTATPPAAPDGREGASPPEDYRGAPWPSSGSWPAPPSGSRPVPGAPESPAAENPAAFEAPAESPSPPGPSAAGNSAAPEPCAAPEPSAGDNDTPAAPGPSAGDGPAAPEVRVAAPAPRVVASPELPRPITVTPGTPPPRYASELWFPGPRRTFADEQVWPPVARSAGEPPGPSTQPFPAVPAAPPSLPAPPVPGPGEPREAGGTSAGAREAGPPAAAGTVPGPRASGEDAPAREETAPARRRTASRIGAVSLLAALVVVVAAVVAVTLAPGIPVRNDHRPRHGDVSASRVHVVAPKGTGVLMNVAWRVGVEQADALPATRPAGPGLRWLRITVTRTSLNAEGVARRAAPGIEVRHPDGRSWQAEIVRDGLPAAVGDHLIGAEYAYEAISLVPREVAGVVEVQVTPSAARMPLEDRLSLKEDPVEMFARPDAARPEPQDRVLLFRR